MDDDLLQGTDAALAGWADPVARLRQALEKNEFELYCQPILSLGAGGYPMGEILVRLREEERALLPPGEFLPAFEHYRMMPQLDRWVVRTAVRLLAAGSRIPCFSVNLSGQTLEDHDFVRFVAAQLGMYKVKPGALAFEIDESDTLVRLDAAQKFAAAYLELGGRVMIDGFGRRSVSFAAIKSLGVAFVKVDGSIVRKLAHSEPARNKLNAMARVGTALGFALIAECVEDQDVLVRLKSSGVGFAQGFGIAQPQPVATLKR